MRHSKLRLMALCIMLVLLAVGCKKKPAPVTPPPPAPPPVAAPAPKPTATLTASPASIERGQSTTIEWSTQNSDKVSIAPEIGSVSTSGSRSVRPQQSTTYHLTATGPGGNVEASARVTVTAPPPVIVNAPKPVEEDIDAIWARTVKSISFDYDKYDVRDDQKAALQADADFFRAHPDASIQVEGNCDERGSEEYNLGLGDRRANALKEALVNLGVPVGRINTISYGKERPKCTDANEACWQQNRRGDFTRKR
jgi:peptidoglycan-associated lipoprotein